MLPLKNMILSSVGKKFLMSLSGLAMVGFLVGHLSGNFTLFASDGEPFNAYAKFLADFGVLLYLVEMGLFATLVVHMAAAIQLTFGTRKAQQVHGNYQEGRRTKRGPSYYNSASTNMIVTGLVLFVFLVVHILHFKIGAFGGADYTTTLKNGEQARDLYRLVVESFQNEFWVLFYVLSMTFVGWHLRHGFWSGFQSLGALNSRLEKPMYIAGLAVSASLAIGFLGIPIYIYIAH